MIDIHITKENCMGCHACASICPHDAITMKADHEGFLYPIVNYKKCVMCRKCIDICPYNTTQMPNSNIVSYACINKNDVIRQNSSSGGIFTLIADEIIANDGVVFGAIFNEKFEVEHQYVVSKERLHLLRGSKYVQSAIGYTYRQAKEYLDMGRIVMFSGTPCQIAGLYSYIGEKRSNLITIDVICHGVPSTAVWRKYVQYRETVSGSPAHRVNFRRKNQGWKLYSLHITFKNNKEYTKNLLEDLYMKAFLTNVCLRPSCYKCQYATLERQGDITLADFWGIQYVLPDMDDDKGTSLVIINTKAGKEIFNRIKSGMRYKEVNIHAAIKYNAAATKPAIPRKSRKTFYKKLRDTPFRDLVNKCCSDGISKIVTKKLINRAKKCLKDNVQ